MGSGRFSSYFSEEIHQIHVSIGSTFVFRSPINTFIISGVITGEQHPGILASESLCRRLIRMKCLSYLESNKIFSC